MDKNTELIIKMMELDGKKNYLMTQFNDKLLEINGYVDNIGITRMNKDIAAREKVTADNYATRMAENVANAEADYNKALEALNAAKAAKEKADANAGKFSPEFFAGFDKKVDSLTKKKAVADGEKKALTDQVAIVQADIDALTKELEEHGIKLNLNIPKAHRSSVI
jgi:NAD-specific glutamate dehydrogenase